MDVKQIAATASGARDLWEQLKKDWHKYGLPGSSYSPDEFLACLLIAQSGLGRDELVARVKGAQEILSAMKSGSLISASDTNATLLIALIQQPTQSSAPEPVQPAEPAEVPQTTACPHCGHNFNACERGEYEQPPQPAPEPVAEEAEASTGEEPAGETEETTGCCHVGTDGKCVDCTQDKTDECSGDGCDQTIVVSKGHACKNPECGRVFCDNCAENELNEHGYCGECSELECACENCEEKVDAGGEPVCKNPECKEKPALCEECAKDLLDERGFCWACC